MQVRVDASGNVIDPDREPNRYREGSPLRLRKNEEEDRYEYRIECEEDARISPYIPEWLLVWGANMNIQYCTSGGFLSYISKYVCKPEPSGLVPDMDSHAVNARTAARLAFSTRGLWARPRPSPTYSATS